MDEKKPKIFLTREGLKKIKKEFDVLQKQRSKINGEEAPNFLESEDLNPEYLSYQENLSMLESKLAQMVNILKNAELIQAPPKEKRGVVDLGATVTVEMDGETEEFTIVGVFESDPLKNKISDESPIGRALRGKKIGDLVEIKTPLVNHACKILKIKY